MALANHFKIPVEVLTDDTLDLPGTSLYPPDGPDDMAVQEPSLGYGETDQITRLEQGIAWLEREVSELKAQRAAAERSLAAREAANDAELKKFPGVADALEAGLTLDDIRAMIRAEVARRRAAQSKPFPRTPTKPA